jgi:hyperosmotically inducible periplasmic protein
VPQPARLPFVSSFCNSSSSTDMPFSMMVQTLLIGFLLTSAAVTTTSCALENNPKSADVKSDDKTITTAVKQRFLDSPQVDGRAINVEARNGTVLLTGVAASYAEKSGASEIALSVQGVRLVQNEITVRQ